MSGTQQGTTTSRSVYPGQSGDQIQNTFSGVLGAYQNTPFQGYSGQLVAPNNGYQNTAAAGIAGAAHFAPQQVSAPSYGAAQVTNPGYYQGLGYTAAPAGATSYNATMGQASQIGAGQVHDVNAQTVGSTNFSTYMNPYTQSVIDTTTQQLARNNAQQQQQISSQAAMNGAFGGDRSAIAAQEQNRNYDQTLGQTVAGLNNQNFMQAQAAATGDVSRNLTAQQSNQSTGLNIAGQNLNSSNTFGLANMNAANTASQYNATNQQQANQFNAAATNAANQFTANAGNQSNQFNAGNNQQVSLYNAGADNQARQFNAGQNLSGQQLNQYAGIQGANINNQANSALYGFGTQQQQTAQAQNDAQYGQFMRHVNFPYQQAQGQEQAVSSFAPALAGARTNYNTYPAPSTTGQILGGITAATGLAGMWNGTNKDGSTNGISGLASSAVKGISNLYDGSSLQAALNGGYSGLDIGGSAKDFTNSSSDIADAGLDQWLPAANGGRIGMADGGEVGNDFYTPAYADGGETEMTGSGEDYNAPWSEDPGEDTPGVGGILAQVRAAGGQPDTSGYEPAPAGYAKPEPIDPVPSRAMLSADPSGGISRQSEPAGNSWAQPLLAAGLGMLASRSPNAGTAIGDGGLAGMAQMNAQPGLEIQRQAGITAGLNNQLLKTRTPLIIDMLNKSYGAQGGIAGAANNGVAGGGQRIGNSQNYLVDPRSIAANMNIAAASGDYKSVAAMGAQLQNLGKEGFTIDSDGNSMFVPGYLASLAAQKGTAAGAEAWAKLEPAVREAALKAQIDIGVHSANAGTDARYAEPIKMTVPDGKGGYQDISIPRPAWAGANGGPASGGVSGVGGNPTGGVSAPTLGGNVAPIASPGVSSPLVVGAAKQAGISPQLLAFTMDREGYKANPYQDGKGLAFGYGSTAPSADATISQPDAVALVAKNLATAQVPVKNAAASMGYNFTPDQIDALTSFNQNTGQAENILKQAGGDVSKVPALMQQFNTQDGKVMNGLTTRRAMEGQMFTGSGQSATSGQPASTAAQFPGAIVGKSVLAPRTPEETKMSETYGDQFASISNAYKQAPINLGKLDELDTAAAGFRPGSTGAARLAASKGLTDVLQMMGVTVPQSLADGTASGETIQKISGGMVSDMVKSLGSHEALGVFNAVKGIMPNIEMSKGGFDVITNSLRQGVMRDRDLGQFQDQWLADPSHKNSIAGMTTAFEKANPIEAYASRVVPYPTPKSLSNLKPNVIYRNSAGKTAMFDGTHMVPVQ